MSSILGTDGVIETDANGPVVAAPRSEEECALILAAAHEEGWTVRLDGRASWIPPDAPADLAISTRMLVGISDFSPADLVLTARAGTPLDDIQDAAGREGMWIALDPPGADRSIGSVVSTGTAGPLRTGFGAVKSRILGLTFITADGRIARVGGRVVKNVAGFDLTSLLVGSFGAFGLITSAHVRLNAIPKADLTLIARQSRDVLLRGALAILAGGHTPAALELISPDPTRPESWTLAVRVLGPPSAVFADRAKITACVPQCDFEVLDRDSATRFWAAAAMEVTKHTTTIRMGSRPSELPQALDLMFSQLGGEAGVSLSTSILAGVTRWSSSDAATPRIRDLRLLASRHDWPVTLERAPWSVREKTGHYGAYRDGVGGLVASLRVVFDPAGALVVPQNGTP